MAFFLLVIESDSKVSRGEPALIYWPSLTYTLLTTPEDGASIVRVRQGFRTPLTLIV